MKTVELMVRATCGSCERVAGQIAPVVERHDARLVLVDVDGDDDDNYDGLEFKRVPYLERRQVERNSRGGPKSWIYRHGWAVWHRKYKKNYWLCRYCHQRRKQEACYEADSTTNAGRHLKQQAWALTRT